MHSKNEIRLLATDFDGTLLGRLEDLKHIPKFLQSVMALRATGGTWVISTGRSLHRFRAVFKPFSLAGLRPDFLIVEHAFVYSVTAFGYQPHVVWNTQTVFRQWHDRRKAAKFIRRWHKILAQAAPRTETLHQTRSHVLMRFDSEENAVSAEEILRAQMTGCPHVYAIRQDDTIEMQVAAFDKGLALAELVRHLGLSSRDVLAIGDGDNDICMMEGSVADMTGCPANSGWSVMHAVKERQGHISKSASLAGVLDIIRAYQCGEVCSDVPDAGWNKETKIGFVAPPASPSRENGKKAYRWTFFTLLSLGIVLILTLSSLHMFPYSDDIWGPIEKSLKKLMALFFDLLP
jgi:HAD superfamily hydrolase (TIGR01484 family)